MVSTLLSSLLTRTGGHYDSIIPNINPIQFGSQVWYGGWVYWWVNSRSMCWKFDEYEGSYWKLLRWFLAAIAVLIYSVLDPSCNSDNKANHFLTLLPMGWGLCWELLLQNEKENNIRRFAPPPSQIATLCSQIAVVLYPISHHTPLIKARYQCMGWNRDAVIRKVENKKIMNNVVSKKISNSPPKLDDQEAAENVFFSHSN